ncbi:MAG: hypothetical protein ACR2G5_09795 [Pyrinomonadaceae bacterium]
MKRLILIVALVCPTFVFSFAHTTNEQVSGRGKTEQLILLLEKEGREAT